MHSKTAILVFPHQLFEKIPFKANVGELFLIEEKLFFTQFKFHRQKLVFHRASMKFYEDYLKRNNFKVKYIEANSTLADIRILLEFLNKNNYRKIIFTEVTDNWLEKRIKKSIQIYGFDYEELPSPLFLNTKKEVIDFLNTKKIYRQTDFYIWQRKKLNVLLDNNQRPFGGKWTFDAENRKKYPKNLKPPLVEFPQENKFYKEAKSYITNNFPDNYGELNESIHYPTTFEEAKIWFRNFLEQRFYNYGLFQDAILRNEIFLNHSLLSMVLNNGLISPKFVLEEAIDFGINNKIPINSLEGFIRQIIGWREFIRAVYEVKGTFQRNSNFWNVSNKIPESFWSGDTGIEPIDITIKKLLKTAYNHHIERLMIIGNFMLLCQFDPDEVYKWFMTFYIDAYDWVMVPNVYGMSQFADGGLISTKPYISGSNYLKKMSDFQNGDWQIIWDSLFWNFLLQHRNYFSKNPRLNMLLNNFDRVDTNKKKLYIETANKFLEKLLT